MGKCVLKGLEKYQASDKSQMTYHHHCSENSQLKTWRVLKECQYELGCIDLSVWILLIHRHTEFCPLLSVFYHWFKCWKERKKKEEGEGWQAAAVWEGTNLPSQPNPKSPTCCQELRMQRGLQRVQSNCMLMLISYICTCFALCKVAFFTLSHLLFTANTAQVLIFPSDG